MEYLYALFPFIVWVISQTIKFTVRLARPGVPGHLKGLFWTYIWAGGPPSTHTAILTSSLVLIWNRFGFSSLLTFCIAVAILWMYDMANEHKKQRVFERYLSSSGSASLIKSVEDGYVLDLSGHNVLDLMLGALLGLTLGFIAIQILP